jgi:hypothetical protein
MIRALTVLLCSLATPVWASEAIWLRPVMDADADSHVPDLTTKLIIAGRQVAPTRPWRVGPPTPHECPTGCDIVDVQGHRGAAYTVFVQHWPTGPRRALVLDATPHAALFDLAEALAIAAVFLLDESAPATQHPAPASAVAPPSTAASVWAMSLGPSVTRARTLTTGGSELGARWRISPLWGLAGSVGMEAFAIGKAAGRAAWRQVPATVTLGLAWARGPLTLSAGAGLRMALWSPDPTRLRPTERDGIDMAAVAEARASLQLQPRIHAVCTVRPAYSLAPGSERSNPLPRDVVQLGASLMVDL